MSKLTWIWPIWQQSWKVVVKNKCIFIVRIHLRKKKEFVHSKISKQTFEIMFFLSGHIYMHQLSQVIQLTQAYGYNHYCSIMQNIYISIYFTVYRVSFFYDPISFSCHFYTNKDIDMRSFVTCSGHRVIFL